MLGNFSSNCPLMSRTLAETSGISPIGSIPGSWLVMLTMDTCPVADTILFNNKGSLVAISFNLTMSDANKTSGSNTKSSTIKSSSSAMVC